MNPIEPVPITPTPITPRVPFWDYTDLFVFAMLLFASLGMSLIFAILLMKFTTLAVGWKLILPQLVLYALGLTGLAAIFRFRYDQPLWRSLDWKPISLSMTLSTLFAGPVLALTLGLIGAVLHPPEIELPFQQMLGSNATTISLGIVVVILGPLCEELAFRGFLMPLLVRSLGTAIGIVITGLIFGSMHGYEYQWSWQYVLLISLAGCVFGWAKYKTHSTAAAAFMHSTFNLAQFAGFLWRIRTL
jgi:membrane protease YdiL (CAAX protease family)